MRTDGRSARWQDHRQARRAELAHTARKVVHHGGPDVSMDEIAAAAGTSKSIVYRYFIDKAGLQQAVAQAVVTDIRAALAGAAVAAGSPRDALGAMVDTYLAMIESAPHVYTFVTRDGSVGQFLGQITELVAASFLAAAPAGARSRILAWAAGAVGFVRGAGEHWLADPGRGARAATAEQITTWLWCGPNP